MVRPSFETMFWAGFATVASFGTTIAAFSPAAPSVAARTFQSHQQKRNGPLNFLFTDDDGKVPLSSLSRTSSAYSPLRKSTTRSRTTRLFWSPMDEPSPPGGEIGKAMMMIGTTVEITRAIMMGAVSEVDVMHWLNGPALMEYTLTWGPFFAATGLAWSVLSHPEEGYRTDMEPYARGKYDPEVASEYYKRHPILVIKRISELLRLSQNFLLALLLDKVTGNVHKNRPQRAQELLELITELGPTAIKVGQVLSIRPDLIPEEFADALATLQDRVPPFTCEKAKQILMEELGPEKVSHLQGVEKGPVASASIGQVYKVTLDGQEHAVKVQRPNVLAEIALDLYIVRELAPLYKAIMGSSSDLKLLANEWGRGFIAELDYRMEAANTQKFNTDMAARNMNAVMAPKVVPDYSTERILVTEWVDGTRIDKSDAGDIPRLCSVALNAYLVMLLELNQLHCDPHPGNLLRTKDGKLCILDFGMTLDIDPNLQYSLLEYVAHLTADDYDQLPEDLTKLGFLAPDKLEFARRSGVLEPLKYFLKQVGQGGGAQRFRDRIMSEYREKYPGMSDEELRSAMRTEMQQHIKGVADRESVTTGLTMEVEELQRQNRDSFRIPEWFLYTSRAFLTLEGVSLSANPNYSLIKSCFPYVAKRLVGDDDPRARRALKDMLYGAGENVDPKRVSDILEGFSSYTATTKTVSNVGKAVEDGVQLATDGTMRLNKKDKDEKLQEIEGAVTLAKDSADILLTPGGVVQDMLVEESVLAASARFKDDMKEAVLNGPERLRESMPFGVGKILPPLPFEKRIKSQLEPFIRKTTSEKNAQVLAEKMVQLLPQGGNSDEGADNVLLSTLKEMEPESAALLVRELRENVPKYAPLVGKLGSKFASTLLNTASSNIESTLQELEKAGHRTDVPLRFTAKGLSDFAKRGSNAFGGAVKNQKDLPRIVPIDLGTNNSTIF